MKRYTLSVSSLALSVAKCSMIMMIMFAQVDDNTMALANTYGHAFFLAEKINAVIIAGDARHMSILSIVNVLFGIL